MRIGFVGPGRLGLPMVERLAAAGHDLIVHARRQEVRERLASLGVRSTPDLGETAREREVALVCVYDDTQLSAVAEELCRELPPGAVLASHVTGEVETLRRLARRHLEVEVVDAPVSGTADDIRAGALTVLLGGAPWARSRTAAAVRCYASAVLESGDLGAALSTKLVNNLLLAANTQLLASAARLGEGLGIAPESLLATLGHMSGGSRAAELAAQRPPLAEFARIISPFLAKDVSVCRTLADEHGADAALLLDVVGRGPLDLA
ncbi:NAD(P)-binding domain-containing protein [Nocardioides sp. cx-169]|uniref:NAD(P)-dependent oxidoreductase n=1 Tax=Nocardioides sp. cx-169 TaxID=2899080 RepID=UPI001E4B7398|nr:NAD(P)-binding domain-containing protein [Nocardioides sp. cx-169]MCD4533039.1 NAD(P)-binding domain-containing protein [Nocardioides sp. cx-169]